MSMFNASLNTIARITQYPESFKCPKTEEWGKKLWHIYVNTYNISIRNWMEHYGWDIMLCKIMQKEDIHYIVSLIIVSKEI